MPNVVYEYSYQYGTLWRDSHCETSSALTNQFRLWGLRDVIFDRATMFRFRRMLQSGRTVTQSSVPTTNIFLLTTIPCRNINKLECPYHVDLCRCTTYYISDAGLSLVIPTSAIQHDQPRGQARYDDALQ